MTSQERAQIKSHEDTHRSCVKVASAVGRLAKVRLQSSERLKIACLCSHSSEERRAVLAQERV